MMAAKRRALNFKLVEAMGRDDHGMRKSIDRFTHAVKKAEFSLFFYADHSMENDSNNYQLPADEMLQNESNI